MVLALLDAAGRSCPDAIADALRRGGHALAVQLGKSEPEPTYGDADDGIVVRLGGSQPRTGRAIAAPLQRASDASARAAAAAPDLLVYWLFRETGATRFALTEPAPPPGSTLLPDAGVVILARVLAGSCSTLARWDTGNPEAHGLQTRSRSRSARARTTSSWILESAVTSRCLLCEARYAEPPRTPR